MEKFRRVIDEPTVAAMWEGYSRAVLEPSEIRPHTVQWQESRRIFYAACGAVLSLIVQIVDRVDDGDEGMDEVSGAILMEALDLEIQAFMMKVGQGEPGY